METTTEGSLPTIVKQYVILPKDIPETPFIVGKMNSLVRDIEQWARDRNLHEGDPVRQCAKLFEEGGELTKATIRLAGAQDKDSTDKWLAEAKDGIGDCFVVLTIVAMRLGLNIQDCIQAAYTEIKDRKGSNVNGVFLRETTIGQVPT